MASPGVFVVGLSPPLIDAETQLYLDPQPVADVEPEIGGQL